MIVTDNKGDVVGSSHDIQHLGDNLVRCMTGDETWYAIQFETNDWTIHNVDSPNMDLMWSYIDGQFKDISPKWVD